MTRPAIIDTNIVVSGLLSRHASSPPARIVDAMLSGAFPFVLSPDLLAEYRAVLSRSKLSKLHGLSSTDLRIFLTALTASAFLLELSRNHLPAPDPGDQLLWDLLAFNADVILVTGDRLLLESRIFGPRILSAFAFCQSWKQASSPAP